MHKTLTSFLESKEDGHFYIGHASSLVRIAGYTYFFDPIWNASPYGRYWHFYPEQIDCSDVLSIADGIFVSHIHADHCHPEILKQTKWSGSPVFTMEGRPYLQNRIPHVCTKRTLAPFVWHRLNEKVECYFVPHAFNKVDSSVFVRSKDFCFYHGNDNFLSSEILEKIKPDIGKVDLACVPYAFVHSYPFLLTSLNGEEMEKEIKRLSDQSITHGLDFVFKFKPKVVIPYGASLYYGVIDKQILNDSLVSVFDFRAISHAKYPHTRVFPQFAGDSVLFPVGGVVIDDSFKYSITEFNKNLSQALKEKYNSFEDGSLDIIRGRVEQASKKIPDYQIIVNDIVIDCEKLTVKWGCYGKTTQFIRFDVDQYEFWQWLLGIITFEQLIGTRRFTYRRVPNEYRLDVVEFYNSL